MSKIYNGEKYYVLEELKKLIEKGLYDEFGNKLTNWVSFPERSKRYVYVPCTEEYFHWDRNEKRNDERREIAAKKRCPISIDQMYEDHDFEYADNSYYENQERERAQEVSDLIWSLVSEFDQIDQEIIRLYNEGHTDSYISQQVNMPRSTIQWRKRMVIELLKEKMNKIR
jgi:hypothetical protein